MRYLLLVLVGVGLLLAPVSASAGLLRDIVDTHRASHGQGDMTRAQWKAYIKSVEGRSIRGERIVVQDVSCKEKKNRCSVSGYPYPQGNDFLPRVTWRWLSMSDGLKLSRGDVIQIQGTIDIFDFMMFGITVE